VGSSARSPRGGRASCPDPRQAILPLCTGALRLLSHSTVIGLNGRSDPLWRVPPVRPFPELSSLRQLSRRHIEAFPRVEHSTRTWRGPRGALIDESPASVVHRGVLSLRNFFGRHHAVGLGRSDLRVGSCSPPTSHGCRVRFRGRSHQTSTRLHDCASCPSNDLFARSGILLIAPCKALRIGECLRSRAQLAWPTHGRTGSWLAGAARQARH